MTDMLKKAAKRTLSWATFRDQNWTDFSEYMTFKRPETTVATGFLSAASGAYALWGQNQDYKYLATAAAISTLGLFASNVADAGLAARTRLFVGGVALGCAVAEMTGGREKEQHRHQPVPVVRTN